LDFPGADIMAVEPLDFTLDSKSGAWRGIHPIPLVRRTVAAFIGRTERGPVNEPVEIEDFEQFRKAFGAHCTFSFVAHAVQQYFLHGGQVALVVRVANRATRARLEVPAEGQFLHFQARNPGAHEFLRVSVDYDGVEEDRERFNLVIQRMRGPTSPLVADQELYPRITMQHSDQRFIVDVLQDSKLVRLNGPLPGNRPNATLAKSPGAPIPYIALTEFGTDGEELTDYDVIGSNQEATGLFALESVRAIDLLCIPAAPNADLGTTAFLAAERYCEKRRAILVCDPPASWTSAHAAVIGMRNSSYSSRNAMLYFPRIRPRGESTRYAAGVPACGAVAGMLARHDLAGVWDAASVALKASLAPTVALRGGDVALLRRFGINAMAPGNGGSTILAGNVTLGGANAISKFWQPLDRRRLFFFILKSIEEATRWVPERLEADTIAAELDLQVRTFLAGLFERGALAGNAPAQAFFVAVARPGALEPEIVLRCGMALHKPNDFIVYEARYQRDGMRTRQVPLAEAEQLFL
jgi:hypothetical protein